MASKNQKTFSSFFRTMIQMRKILDRTFEDSSNSKIPTLLQVQALEIIQKNQNITASQLGSQLQMSPSAVTQLADRLFESNLISRIQGMEDRRSVHLVLTSIGKKHLDNTMKKIEQKTKRILAPISEKDLNIIVNIFSNFLEKHRSNADKQRN
jgi:DNA-binding MarR family transcriptional regulator